MRPTNLLTNSCSSITSTWSASRAGTIDVELAVLDAAEIFLERQLDTGPGGAR
jgi:hypothetical protein